MEENKPKRLLAILAHPDDESYGAGGTLAMYAHEGVEIVLLCATRGQAGIPGKSPEEAAQIREHELREAARFLGIEVFFLDYLDGALQAADINKLLEYVVCWIDTVDPQVVLTFGPDGVSGHPDHVTLSRIVTRAVEKYFPAVCLLYIAPSEVTELGCGVSGSVSITQGSLISVDISGYKIEKVHAIQCHGSQHPPLTGKVEEEVEKIPCHEYFKVAHSIIEAHDLLDCFEARDIAA